MTRLPAAVPRPRSSSPSSSPPARRRSARSGTPADPAADRRPVARGAVRRRHARPLVARRRAPRAEPSAVVRRPASPSSSPDRRPRRRARPPPPRRPGRRDDDRPRLLLPRQLHRQRGPRPGAARGPADEGRRDGRDARAARRPGRCRDGRPARDVHRRSPTARRCSGSDDRGRHRHRQPVAGVRVRRRQRVDAGRARPGRLHAHPVPDRRPACGSSSTACPSPRSAARASCSDQPVGRDDFRTSCRRSSSTGRRGARASATPARSAAMANVFEATFQVELLDAGGARSSARPGDGVLRHRAAGARSGPRSRTRSTEGQWGTLRVLRAVRAGRLRRERHRVPGLAHAGPARRRRAASRHGAASSSRTAGSIRSVTQRRYWAAGRVEPVGRRRASGPSAASPEIAKIPSTNGMSRRLAALAEDRVHADDPRPLRRGVAERGAHAASRCSRASRRTGSGPAGAAPRSARGSCRRRRGTAPRARPGRRR